MRKGVVIAAHDYGGHFAVDRTVARITDDYWFAGMKRYVKQHIAMCVDCLTNKKPATKTWISASNTAGETTFPDHTPGSPRAVRNNDSKK